MYSVLSIRKEKHMPGIVIIAAAEAAPTFDTGLVVTILDVCKKIMSLFGEYPLNIMLAISIACMCFGVFAVAKRSAH